MPFEMSNDQHLLATQSVARPSYLHPCCRECPGRMKPKGKKHGETHSADQNREGAFERSHALEMQLLQNIKARSPELAKLLEKVSSHWYAEDGFYRFYHQSFKVYRVQAYTVEVVEALRSLLPDRPLTEWFEQIVREGTGKQFRREHNERWLAETRPILEAFFHARTMLELPSATGKNSTRRRPRCPAVGQPFSAFMVCAKIARLTSSLRSATMRPVVSSDADQLSFPRAARRAGGKLATKDTLIRQWEILKRIPARRPGITVGQLADMLRDECDIAVTRRTVERDLEGLSGIFPLYCNDVSKPFGWRWTEGASIGLPGLDICDALSLLVARDALRQMLPAAMLEALEHKFSEAERKLQASGASRLATWPDKVRYMPPALAFLPPKIPPEVLKTVQTALITDRQVAVSYDSPDCGISDLTLHPLALVHRGPVSYLVATAFDYPDVRLYAMHRIAKASVSEQPANRPKDFSIDKYLAHGAMDFSPSEPIQLKATVSDTLAHYLTESPLNGSQSITRNNQGHIVLKVRIRDSWQLRWWILSRGAVLVLLEPKGLREAIAGTVLTMHKEYSK